MLSVDLQSPFERVGESPVSGLAFGDFVQEFVFEHQHDHSRAGAQWAHERLPSQHSPHLPAHFAPFRPLLPLCRPLSPQSVLFAGVQYLGGKGHRVWAHSLLGRHPLLSGLLPVHQQNSAAHSLLPHLLLQEKEESGQEQFPFRPLFLIFLLRTLLFDHASLPLPRLLPVDHFDVLLYGPLLWILLIRGPLQKEDLQRTNRLIRNSNWAECHGPVPILVHCSAEWVSELHPASIAPGKRRRGIGPDLRSEVQTLHFPVFDLTHSFLSLLHFHSDIRPQLLREKETKKEKIIKKIVLIIKKQTEFIFLLFFLPPFFASFARHTQEYPEDILDS